MVQKYLRPSLVLVIGLLLCLRCFANMAAPLGYWHCLPFMSLHVDVRHERINICPSADFKTCRYDVVYDIFADTAGLRIPMLFIAHHYNGGMQVWVDGQAVELKQLPERYYRLALLSRQCAAASNGLLRAVKVPAPIDSAPF